MAGVRDAGRDERLTLEDHVALAKAPRLRPGGVRQAVGRMAGEAWNAPNQAVGLTYGYLGNAAGKAWRLIDRDAPEPQVVRRNGRTEFLNNPFGGVGAITIGDTTTYNDDPYSPDGRKVWRPMEEREGHPVWEHEQAHSIQSRQLGPAYLPSNLLGGLNALMHGEKWGGPHNWNEQGPKMNPPRGWPPRSR